MKNLTLYKVYLLGITLLLTSLTMPALAAENLQVGIDVIKADRVGTVDPQLNDLLDELSPILNFAGFTLVKKSMTTLSATQTDEVRLSEERTLKLEFQGFDENQARLQVMILEKGKETFRTVVLLVDNGSVLIGGPPHEGGVLLLRISGEFK